MAEASDRVTRRRSFGDLSNPVPMAGIGDLSNSDLMAGVSHRVTQRKSFGDLPNSALPANMELDGNAEALVSIHNKLSQLSEARTQPFIYKVEKPLRDVNPKAYEPEIIAIGPYHHGKDDLKMMEEHKVRYLESLLQRNNEINIERYISAVAEIEPKARDCYAEPISLTKAEFIEMLVLDGCFIIELLLKISKAVPTRANDPIVQRERIMYYLQRDLLLFENQIPFFVLCELFDLIEVPNQHNKLIDLVLNFCQILCPGSGKRNRTEKVKHILDFIHRNWSPFSDDVHIDVEVRGVDDFRSDDVHIDVEVRGVDDFRYIPSATELTYADVRFRRSECDTPFEVQFYNGVMQMPPLKIDDRTECFFRNLIVYEQYFANHQRAAYVTDYIRLLNCLISSTRDVKILSERGIIYNWLGDDELVPKTFHQLIESATGPGKYFIYEEIFRVINAHYKRPWNKARSLLNPQYLRYVPRWGYISSFGGLMGLLLTLAQTVFSALEHFKA